MEAFLLNGIYRNENLLDYYVRMERFLDWYLSSSHPRVHSRGMTDPVDFIVSNTPARGW